MLSPTSCFLSDLVPANSGVSCKLFNVFEKNLVYSPMFIIDTLVSMWYHFPTFFFIFKLRIMFITWKRVIKLRVLRKYGHSDISIRVHKTILIAKLHKHLNHAHLFSIRIIRFSLRNCRKYQSYLRVYAKKPLRYQNVKFL